MWPKGLLGEKNVSGKKFVTQRAMRATIRFHNNNIFFISTYFVPQT
jgi:hypothetical protein